MNEATKHLLSGLLTDTGIGAGIGAAGMGAAEAFSPEEEGKKKSILKSMLLGGALGGLTGAGVRSFSDALQPELQHDPRSMLASMFENKQEPAPTPHGFFENGALAAAGHPALAGLGAGGAAAGFSAYKKSGVTKEMMSGGQISEKLKNYINTPRGMRLSRYPTMHPLTHGALAGAGTYALSRILNGEEVAKDMYGKFNNPNALSEHIHK